MRRNKLPDLRMTQKRRPAPSVHRSARSGSRSVGNSTRWYGRRGDGRSPRNRACQVDTLRLDVVRKDIGVVARVEQDALAAVLDQRRNPKSFVIAEVLPKAS